MVCERWRKFENFLADMGEPQPGESINRIDNSKGYEPGNCKWADLKEQGRNKRNNQLLTHDGETLSLSEWAERKGLQVTTLWRRLFVYRWQVERALTSPLIRGRSPVARPSGDQSPLI